MAVGKHSSLPAFQVDGAPIIPATSINILGLAMITSLKYCNHNESVASRVIDMGGGLALDRAQTGPIAPATARRHDKSQVALNKLSRMLSGHRHTASLKDNRRCQSGSERIRKVKPTDVL